MIVLPHGEATLSAWTAYIPGLLFFPFGYKLQNSFFQPTKKIYQTSEFVPEL